jgi:hypothetical protein
VIAGAFFAANLSIHTRVQQPISHIRSQQETLMLKVAISLARQVR